MDFVTSECNSDSECLPEKFEGTGVGRDSPVAPHQKSEGPVGEPEKPGDMQHQQSFIKDSFIINNGVNHNGMFESQVSGGQTYPFVSRHRLNTVKKNLLIFLLTDIRPSPVLLALWTRSGPRKDPGCLTKSLFLL
ncbi:hypothetical protein Hanom_Chr13g01206171 [Helianthus anomalus]